MPDEKEPPQSIPSVSDRLKTEYEQFTEIEQDTPFNVRVPIGPVESGGNIHPTAVEVITGSGNVIPGAKSADPGSLSDVEKPQASEAEPGVPPLQREDEQPGLGMAVLTANVGDQPTAQDSLGFNPYVEAIAAFLTNRVTNPPLTLSIEGEWGSGKSSFMMQLEAELRKSSSRIVQFNAWRYDKDDAMWATFALKFARDLSQQMNWRERWLAHLKLFWRRFDWHDGWKDIVRVVLLIALLAGILAVPILMKDRITEFLFSPAAASETNKHEGLLERALKPLVGAGGGLAYIALVISLAASLKEFLGNPLRVNLKHHLNAPDYKSRVAFIERFHEDFGRVAEVYGKKEKIFVFVDDLDRCEIPRAADLMQGINLMISDSSQLIFIMGMDREKVAAGLAVKYEKLLPYLAPPRKMSNGQPHKEFDPVFGLEYGYSFIEKFIQLPFLVPQASVEQVNGFLEKLFGARGTGAQPAKLDTAKIQSISGRKAEEAVTDDSKIIGDILKMVAPTFEYNPRRLKQFINAFRLKTFIASRTGLFEKPTEDEIHVPLTIQQLGKFVAIGLRWPLLLADLDNHRNLFQLLEARLFDRAADDVLFAGLEDRDQVAEVLERWYSRPALRSLLRFGCEPNGSWREEMRRTHTLSKTNINKLLQISPRPSTLSRIAKGPSDPDPAVNEASPSNDDTGPKVGLKS